MKESIIEERLRRALVELEQAKDAHHFGSLLQHNIMAIINEYLILKEEYERRVHFYKNLPSASEFRTLLNEIHAAQKAFYKAIDPQKFSEKEDEDSFKRNTPYSAKEYHEMLASPWEWPAFGSADGHIGIGFVSEYRAPWQETLKKYDLMHPLVLEAEQHGALTESESLEQLFNKMMDDIKHLREMVEGPLYRLKLASFNHVDFYGARPGLIRNNTDSLLRDTKIVCEELLLHFRSYENEQTQRKRKKVIRSILKGIVTTTSGKEFPFKKKNSNSALLCEKVYAYCQHVGDKVSIEKVFPDIWKQSYSSDPLGNRKKVYFASRSANKWSSGKRLPPLLDCDKTHLMRLA